MNWSGLRVLSNPLAVDIKRRVSLVCAVTRRRKRWSVKVEHVQTPGCWQLADGTIVMHPTIYEKLKGTQP